MPVPIAAKAGVIAISVAVAAAIAVYESPEIRRMAEDLRRRIAVALHSLGENIDPNTQTSQDPQEPLFNRPEDAEGFLRSRGVVADDAGMDADDETRRRQREELMYWNAIRESKKEMEREEAEEKAGFEQNGSSRGSTFDDFLQADDNAEKGTYVYNTGADIHGAENDGLVRRRGVEEVRGLSPAIYANPFADENGVDDFNEEPAMYLHALSPGQDEVMSDIYNATEPDRNVALSHTLSPQPQLSQPAAAEVLFDFHNTEPADFNGGLTQSQKADELADQEYMTAGQDYPPRGDAYASIQAWAEASADSVPDRFASSFYSPLPVSPPVPMSEPEVVSDNGMITPTEGSTAGSGEDIADEAVSQTADVGRDVMSDDESHGMATPSSWTEVGSVVSSADEHEPVHA